ncbi:MAG: MgtC/SapB family protein [Candidatus Marsarchaeota archaeon]|nr:MgtC/SapB family protein [Candidatus Marsarchaeota archaeon]
MLEAAISSQELLFALNLLLSLVFGYVIGAERESRGKSAGIATQCLVIAGSMTFSFLSVLMEPTAPTRIASNVVTGIGFLGAGIIFHHAMQKAKDKVVNLTTAATIWMAAAIGMALGFGVPIIALALTIFTIVALRIPHVVPGQK